MKTNMGNNFDVINKINKSTIRLKILGLILVLISILSFIFYTASLENKNHLQFKDLKKKDKEYKEAEDTFSKTNQKLNVLKTDLNNRDSLLTINFRNSDFLHLDPTEKILVIKTNKEFDLVNKLTKGIIFIQTRNLLIRDSSYKLKSLLREHGYSVPDIAILKKPEFINEIKYFDDIDEEKAKDIDKVVSEAFSWTVQIKKYNLSTGKKVQSAGHIEIWLNSIHPGQFPQASEYLLTEKDVTPLSKIELRIMRNEIYARYGYIFRSVGMKSYFSKQPWYQALYGNVDSRLTTIELKNTEFIRKYE